jgi:hypothetical protein
MVGSMVVLIINNINGKQVYNNCKIASLDSAVAIITRLRAKHPRNRGSIPGNEKGFDCFQKNPDRTGVHTAS